MKIVLFILTLMLMLSWGGNGIASEQGKHALKAGANGECSGCDSPVSSNKGAYKVVSSEELKAMLESRTQGLVVIDARTSKEYRKSHIKGAINIPVEALEKNAALLNVPRDAKLIFYCNGIKCGKSKKSANIAMEQGYEDVSVYEGGMPVWEEKGYPLDTGL